MRSVLLSLLALACAMIPQRVNAQQVLSEHDGHTIVRMSMCRTTRCVRKEYAAISKPQNVVRVAYYSKLLALQPESKSAACELLRNIPHTQQQSNDLGILETNLYPGESDSEIRAVGEAYWKFSRNLAHALKRCPQYLPQFIRYGTLAVSPTNAYPNWAARVCRSNPKQFLEAFHTLNIKDQQYIANVVIHPNGCRQIAYPEVP